MNERTNARSLEVWRVTGNTVACLINSKDLPRKCSFASTSGKNQCGELWKKLTHPWKHTVLRDTSAWRWITRGSMIPTGRRSAQWWSSLSTRSWNGQNPKTARCSKAAVGGDGLLGSSCAIHLSLQKRCCEAG